MTRDRVSPLGDERRHYWLALAMARIAGADLQRALDTGRITHGDWADVVGRCRGCTWTKGCTAWMAARAVDETAPVPRACPNAAVLDAVRAAQVEDGVVSA